MTAEDGVGLSEKAFSQQVVDLARLTGWRVARWPTWRPTGTDPGVPDLLLVRQRQAVFAELKSDVGKPTPAQTAWLADLRHVTNVSVHLWRPADWPEIEALLAARPPVGDNRR